MESLLQDVRYGIRMLRKNPGFTATAVLTLALAMGATTTTYSVVHGVLLRAWPYPEAERVVSIWQERDGKGREGISPANFLDLRNQTKSFRAVALVEPFGLDYTGSGEPESIRTALVSEDFFAVLGIGAAQGRTLIAEDYQQKRHVVVLTHGLWQRKFGSDPEVIGRTLILDEKPFVAVGILPADFEFPDDYRYEFWAPRFAAEGDAQQRGETYMGAVARLEDGVSIESARAELAALSARLAGEHPRTNRGMRFVTASLPGEAVRAVRPVMAVLGGAVLFLLLIACANLANLMLARGTERQGEIAVRLALGASKTRLARQVFVESLLLSVLGAAAGVMLAVWLTDLLLGIYGVALPRAAQIVVNAPVLAMTAAACVVAALLFGSAPAWVALRSPLQAGLRAQGTRGATPQRALGGFVVAQICLALVLLSGATLLGRALVRLLEQDLGFDSERLVVAQLFVYGNKYRQPNSQVQFLDEASARFAATPGVTAVGAASFVPFVPAQMDIDTTFRISGAVSLPSGEEPATNVTIVHGDYFRALGAPLLAGRLFSDFDNAQAAPVAVVNDVFARRYFAGQEPLGRGITVRFGRPVERQIVGVVASVRQHGLSGAPVPEVFLPMRQHPFGSMTLVARTSSDPSALVPALKQHIWSLDKDLPIYSISPMKGLIASSVADRRFQTLLLGSFATVALSLAVVGIYGVVAFTTVRRTREVGVRMALGATPANILALVVRSGMRLVAVGVCLGVVAALALTRVLGSALPQVRPGDAPTLAFAVAMMTVVSLLAVYVPARRAAKVDPMVALRYE